jgi:putative ABC transport system ATP-binding protein
MPLIKLENINKTFYLDHVKIEAVKNISLKIESGEFLSIVGPSGSGKTTLLNIIGCLSTPSSGKYFLDGKDVSSATDSEMAKIRNKKIGFVFQSFNLLGKTTALHNVELPLVYGDIPLQQREEAAFKVLQEVGLKNRIKHFPTQLSGGEQQRVAIARALVTEPSLILADEPSGNLDTKSGEQILNILKEMNNQGKTVIIVTHNEKIAKKTKRIIYLSDGEIVQIK